MSKYDSSLKYGPNVSFYFGRLKPSLAECEFWLGGYEQIALPEEPMARQIQFPALAQSVHDWLSLSRVIDPMLEALKD